MSNAFSSSKLKVYLLARILCTDTTHNKDIREFPDSSSPPFSVSRLLEAVSIKQTRKPRILLVANIWHNWPPSSRPTYTLFLRDLGVKPPPTKSIWTTNLPSWTFSPQPQMLQERDLFNPKLLPGSINPLNPNLSPKDIIKFCIGSLTMIEDVRDVYSLSIIVIAHLYLYSRHPLLAHLSFQFWSYP